MKKNKILSLTLLFLFIIEFLSPQVKQFGMVYAAAVPGWQVSKGATGDSDTDCCIDTEEKYSGTGSLKTWNHSKDGDGIDRYGLIETTVYGLQKGKTYKWGFMAKSENSTMTQTYLEWGPPRISLQPFSGTYDWSPFEFTYIHQEDSSQVTLRIAFEDYVEAFWIDDVYFYEIEDGSQVGKNLISNGTFDTAQSVVVEEPNSKTDTSIEGFLKTSGMIPIYKIDSVSIDGDFSDWGESYNRIPLDQKVDINGGIRDMTASIALAWDEKYLYIAGEAADDKHEPIAGGNFWMGDCMQIALSADTEGKNYGTEIGFDYIKETGVSEINQVSHEDLQFKASHDGKIVKYEIAVPWELTFGSAPQSMLFNALFNDTDDGIRKYCLELDPKGISYDKSAKTNPRLVLYEKPEDVPFIMSVKGLNSIAVNTKEQYAVSIFNTSETEKTYQISMDNGSSDSLTVAPQSYGSVNLEYDALKVGNITLKFSASDGTNEMQSSMEVNVMFNETLPTKDEAEQMLKKLDQYVKDIEPLMTQCEFMGYSLVYEKSDARILKKFAALNREKVESGNYKYINYQFAKLTEIYNDLKKSLEQYIAGEAEPKDVPRMVTSEERDIIDGQSFLRDAEYNGQVEKRPYFYMGTGHWNYTWNDLENLKEIGYDFIHVEIGPNSVIFPESFAANWNINVVGTIPDYSVEAQSNQAKDGSYAGKIVNNTEYNYNNFFVIEQTVNVAPNTLYEYGVSAKATEAPASMKLHLGSTPYNDRISMGGTYDWTEYTGTYMTGPNETTVTFHITSDSPCPAFYFDDAYIRKQGSKENLLKNPGFENGKDDPDSIGDGMKVDYTGINQIKQLLKNAEELDMAVDLMITPHYFPTFLATNDPTVNDGGKIPTVFMPFNPTHPTVQKVLEKYVEILVTEIKDCRSLHSIILSNEPAWMSNLGTYYLSSYREFLKEKYNNDIHELNAAYGGSEYTDFEQINWPKVVNASRSWNDYNTFNNSILDQYHAYLANAVRRVAPDIPLHTKHMMTMVDARPNYNRIDDASDYELWTDSFDINGNDGGGASFNDEGKRTIFTLESWYDFLTSVKDAPCVNSEDHILAATDVMDYAESTPIQAAAQLWQGAVHGCGGMNLWIWDTLEFGENNSLLTNRPIVVSKTAKTGFDLNRAAYEVTALQKTKRRVAIMQSNFSNQASENTYNTYSIANQFVLLNGLRPFWLTDRNYANIHDYDLVILPDTVSVSDAAFAEIKKYAENGGKLLLLGNQCLVKDEDGRKRDPVEVKAVHDLALRVVDVAYLGYHVQNTDDIQAAIEDAISAAHLDTVIVRDAQTGDKVDGVEWLTGSYDGNLVINLHNAIENGDKEVYIEVDGKRIGSFTELRSGEYYEDGVITLKTFEPVLIKFEIDNPFIDTYGHWGKDAVTNLFQKGIVNGKTESEFDPDGFLTGGECATLIAKVFGVDISEDGSEQNWYDAAVKALVSTGVADGELSNPDVYINRETVVKLFMRAIEMKRGKAVNGVAAAFSDANDISSDKLTYIEKAVELGIVKGNGVNEFMPKANLTRAEMATIIENIMDVLSVNS